MRRLFLICLLGLIPLVSGCTDHSGKEMQGLNEGDIQFLNRVGSKDNTVCIDGIEYIYYRSGYAGSMAPHLTADENNNPKVIRCGEK